MTQCMIQAPLFKLLELLTSFSSEYQSDALTIIKPLEPLAEERKTRYISSIA